MLVANALSLTVGAGRLFQPISFTLNPGDTLCLKGPSGSGKTSLLRALAWLIPLDTGELRLNGLTPQDLSPPRWRSRVALVPQEAPPLPTNARDLVSRLSDLSIHRAGAHSKGPGQHPTALETRSGRQALAEDFAARLGLTPDALSASFSTLSGGERQRLYLAVVLATEPDVLLLDEPTSALDPEAKRLTEELLHKRTALWVTHDASQAERVATSTLELKP